ncbi:multisite-specific tRNA:(cytosine-C(5))-methyltransferase [Malassezia cuniculi]|uniref:Multisite-specific tRNA:(Cytosine-C(5))-methyltransferase n=1 Tax=Malassezia cuniculi TaxID=948313 RepID=A0AAF0ERY9_9BASI|nr:multisite-specific tRNA:(cytosine-C(5))-methyltransferase [Malassezia cuniculi]
MGRAFRRGRGRGKPASSGERHGEYTQFDQTSPKFDAYYRGQGIVPAEEWDTFIETMRAPLPTTFRITSGKPTARQLLDAMHNIYVPYLSNVEFEGERIAPPRPLEWYPEGLAWHVDVRKNVLRKSPEFRRLQQFLVHETDVGSISRQEAVSMLPPLFLDVRPEHLVLDMCAAPGSKTAQLIEAIHSPLTSEPDAFDPVPRGFVVANDSDTKRAHMLVHQAQRLPSPNLIVTNVDASSMPNVQVPWAGPDGKVQQRELKYDRILADVPCSGDGTLRKNLAIWKDWTPNNGIGLHSLQLRILQRGLALLRPGGRLVYSTCSLNPIENEAVVAAALRANPDVSLVDCSADLPALKRCPGMTSWRVASGKGAHLSKRRAEASGEEASKSEDMPWIESWAELKELDAELAARLPESLWPHGDEEKNHVERCMRVYPHLQNTGGFFVAVLVKQGDDSESMAEGMVRAVDAGAIDRKRAASQEPEEPRKRTRADEEGAEGVEGAADAADDSKTAAAAAAAADGNAAENVEVPADKHAADRKSSLLRKKKDGEEFVIGAGGMPYREDPFVYVDSDVAEVQSCVKWFGLKDFPVGNLLVRNAERVPLRSMYLTSSSVRAVVSGGGPGAGVHPALNPIRLRLLNCGVKVFGRQESTSKVTTQSRYEAPNEESAARRENVSAVLDCRWRVVADSLHSMRPFVSDRIVIPATLEELAFFIREYYPVLERLPGTVGEFLRDAPMGSYILDIRPSEYENHKLTVNLSYPVWRSVASANLMLDKQEKSALSFRLFDSDISDPAGQRQFSSNPQGHKRGSKAAAETTEGEGAEVEGEGADSQVAEGQVAEGAETSEIPATTSENPVVPSEDAEKTEGNGEETTPAPTA